ncbi:MAG: STY4199 family HEPN domain-containing protein [Archangium sp.]
MKAQVDAVFSRIVVALGGTTGDQVAWATLKSKLGRKPLAERIGLNESDLSVFESALADVQRWHSTPSDTARRAEFIELASLRALQWLEVIAAKVGVAGPELISATDEQTTSAKVRALELVLRELINESYRTQDALVTRLRNTFKPDSIEKWKRASSSGDVLTGMTFGELASLFVNREEWPRYQPLLEVDQFLSMLRDRRATLRTYLDGTRLVRNALAHHKPLTAVQRALVDAYAREIFSPLSQSWREGKTTVNPEVHLQASRDGLAEWVGSLADDVREVQDELASLKAEVAGTQRDVSALEGAVVLMLLAGFFVVLTLGANLFDVLTSPPRIEIDLQRVAAQGTRAIRGMGWAAATFFLAMARVGLNVAVFRSGGGAGLRRFLSGLPARLGFAAWAVAGVVVFFAPIHIAAVDSKVATLQSQADMQGVMLAMDEQKLDAFLSNGGDPNQKYLGNSLLHLALIGAPWKTDGGIPPLDESRRERMIKRLLDAGAVVTKEDREFAFTLGKGHLLP